MALTTASRRHRKKKLKAEINVVPYIDVMLVLLIIFMVTAPLLNVGVDVNLPQADATTLEQKKKQPVVVQVDGDVSGIECGTEAEGAVVVGRRSLLRRLLDRQQGAAQLASVAGTRLALVNDPTEQRAAATVDALAATDAVTSPGETGVAAAGRN